MNFTTMSRLCFSAAIIVNLVAYTFGQNILNAIVVAHITIMWAFAEAVL